MFIFGVTTIQKLKRIKKDIKSLHPVSVINSSISHHRAAFLSLGNPTFKMLFPFEYMTFEMEGFLSLSVGTNQAGQQVKCCTKGNCAPFINMLCCRNPQEGQNTEMLTVLLVPGCATVVLSVCMIPGTELQGFNFKGVFKSLFCFKNVLCDLKTLKGKNDLNFSSEIGILFSASKINGKLCFVTA